VSRPRGKSIQRRLAEIAKAMLEPLGCRCEIDFSRSGGHQKLKVELPGGGSTTIELPSSPRCEDHALVFMRQRCQRIARDFRLI